MPEPERESARRNEPTGVRIGEETAVVAAAPAAVVVAEVVVAAAQDAEDAAASAAADMAVGVTELFSFRRTRNAAIHRGIFVCRWILSVHSSHQKLSSRPERSEASEVEGPALKASAH